jgi:integrase
MPAPALELKWTWGDLAEKYVSHISGARIKHGNVREPSQSTIQDMRQSFARSALTSWNERQLFSLTAIELSDAVQCIMNSVSYRQACKMLAYIKAALTWAYSNDPRASGLGTVVPWWQAIRAPQPTGEQVTLIKSRQRPTAVENFSARQVALMLVRHEDFCRSGLGSGRITPAVRFGIWWAALTVVRRGAATKLSQADVRWSDPKLPDGWMMACWPATVVKHKRDLWLPIPPLGVQILKALQRDWRAAVNKSHGAAHTTKWLFPSNRRIGRIATTNDVALSPSSLNTHLANMRGKRKANYRNHLDDLPHFSLHSLRSAATTYLVENANVPDGAASAFLGHALPGDSDPQIAKLARTTDAYYNLAQHIPMKMKAIEAWSEAILDEYRKLGRTISF